MTKKMTNRTIVCLCGSTRFKALFDQVNLEETLAGKIVLSIGCASKTDAELFGTLTEEAWAHVKSQLDELHFAKIELSDEVFIINKDGYIGESTSRERSYATMLGKIIRYLEPPLPTSQDETIGKEKGGGM